MLGALALVIADQMAEAMAEAGYRAAAADQSGSPGRPARLSESGAAALAALLHFLGHPTVDLLRQVLGLTSSGTVRLVDRLAESGYVQRGPGTDGRSTTISLTAAGAAAAQQVAGARAAVLGGAVAPLTVAERAELDRLAGKMLVGMMREPGATRWICRLCDVGMCRSTLGGCPVGNAAIERYGSKAAG